MMTEKTFKVSVRIVIDPIENFNGTRIERDTLIRAKKNIQEFFNGFNFLLFQECESDLSVMRRT